MGGGLMQLVAYGAQDIYLTGNPQITFFKVVYRRHTNFSMEAIKQTFNGSVSTGGSTVNATISRNGDLVSNLWLDVLLPVSGGAPTGGTYLNWTNNTGHALIDNCEVEIGGQRIDRHYSEWLDVWNELTDHDEQEWTGLNKHTAKNAYLKSNTAVTAPSPRLYIPLKFWFCRNPGLALPLIALQYHEVKIKITTRNLLNLINTDATGGDNPTIADPTEFNLWADYIYLDTDERRRFAQVSHEYLIEQVQRSTGAMSASLNHKLNFNHPVKELIWVSRDNTSGAGQTTLASVSDAAANTQNSTVGQGNDWFFYGTEGTSSGGVVETIGGTQGGSREPFGTMVLRLNGHDRFAKRNATYFRTCQPIQAGHKVPSKHIYCYSFALKPEEHQPSGTCNFSRIDNAQMGFTNGCTTSTLIVFAVNYNVLRIMSGMGGLAYSN
jgi:hypothetical protein